MQRIDQMLDATAKTYPDGEAIVAEDATLTFDALNRNVNKLAKGMQKLGIGKGDLVMVQLANGPEIIISHYAIIKTGAVSPP